MILNLKQKYTPLLLNQQYFNIYDIYYSPYDKLHIYEMCGLNLKQTK